MRPPPRPKIRRVDRVRMQRYGCLTPCTNANKAFLHRCVCIDVAVEDFGYDIIYRFCIDAAVKELGYDIIYR